MEGKDRLKLTGCVTQSTVGPSRVRAAVWSRERWVGGAQGQLVGGPGSSEEDKCLSDLCNVGAKRNKRPDISYLLWYYGI